MGFSHQLDSGRKGNGGVELGSRHSQIQRVVSPRPEGVMSNAELNFCKDTRKHPAWKDQTLRVTKACEGPRNQPGVQATAGRQEAAGVGKGAQKAKCQEEAKDEGSTRREVLRDRTKCPRNQSQ